MAEQERLTKAERREQKRERRLEEERAAEAQAAKARRRNLTYAVSLVAIVGVLVYLALGNITTDLSEAITLTRAQAAEAGEANGCEAVDVTMIEDRSHLEPASAPPADQLYTAGRPTASGPHFTNPLPVRNGLPDNAIDERGSTHNLEHGSIIVWIDPETVDGDAQDDIDQWVDQLNTAGFAENQGRAGIFASPLGDIEVDSGKPIAIRGWGVAMDCDSWDRDWANGFVIDHFGTHGNAPEQLAPFPEEVLAFVDDEGEVRDGASDGATDAPTGGDATAGDTASEDATASDSPTDGDTATDGDG